MDTEITPRTIALECLLKTRGLTAGELFDRYRKRCDKLRCMPLWGQFRTAMRTLHKQGLLFVENPGKENELVRLA